MTPITSFGPEGNQWHYHHDTKTYDLTRGREHGFAVTVDHAPQGTSITLSPDTTALVVVDMQNFFLDSTFGSHPGGLAAVERIKPVVAKCREKGIAIIWLNWGLDEKDLKNLPAGLQRSFGRSLIDPDAPSTRVGLGADLGGGMGRTLMSGEWNAAIWPPLAAAATPQDTYCAKNRLSGLWSDELPLWKHLKSSGTTSLMFAGIQTDQCVLGTLADAYNAGWDCIMVDDCCATTTQGAHAVCVRNVSRAYGFVVRSESVLQGLNV